MTAPEPYRNGTHLVVRGRIVVVSEHAPNADGWHYRGSPADLAGDVVTFSHAEATPVTRPMPSTARNLMACAGLSMDVFDQEMAEHSPLGDLLETIAFLIRRGDAPPELHAAYVTYQEAS